MYVCSHFVRLPTLLVLLVDHVRAPPVVPFDVNSPVYVVEVLNLHPGATYRCTLTITNAAGSVVASGADFTAAQEREFLFSYDCDVFLGYQTG